MSNMLYGYCRVSSEEQAQRGISIEAQRNLLNSYAMATGQQIRIYEDAGFSGKNTNRPALRQLLADLDAGGVSSILVWKLDRLSRSLRDTLTMIEDRFQPLGITLVSITESIDTSSPSGRMMLNMLASFAQLEREQDSDRVVMAHKHLAADCKYLGGKVPPGYSITPDKTYQLDPATAPVIRHVFEMYMQRTGYTQILDYLNTPEHLALLGRKTTFKKPDLSYLLRNEIYAGVFIRRMGADPRHRITSPETIRVPGGVPALLTPSEWNQVCAIRTQRVAQGTGAMNRGAIYPLTGLVYCGVCGRLMPLNHGGKSRAGEVERYYTCKSRCVKSARLEKIQNAVFGALEDLGKDPNALRHSCAIANEFAAGVDQDHLAEAAPITDRLQQIAKQSAKLVSAVKKSGADAPSFIMDELRALDREKALLEARLEAATRPASRYDAQKTVDAVLAAANIKNEPPAEQKRLTQAAVYRVLVTQEEFRVLLTWHIAGGDEPPHIICHVIDRKSIKYRFTQYL